MSLLFFDGFEDLATADLTKKYSAASAASVTPSGRNGGRALVGTSTSGFVRRTLGATYTSIVAGGAFKLTSYLTSVDLISFLSGGSPQCFIEPNNNDGSLRVARGTGGSEVTLHTTSALTLPLNVWFYLEFKVVFSNTFGEVIVKVNGVEVINLTGIDTISAGTGTDEVWLGCALTVSADDFYVCSTTGTTNSDFLGDVRVDAIRPSADGTYSGWAPSEGTAHYATVDETPMSAADYNTGVTAGTRDSYEMGNLTALTSSTIYGVEVGALLAKVADTGYKNATTMLRSGGTDYDGDATVLTTSSKWVRKLYETNPNGGVAWTESAVNALEAGVKVI